MATRTQRLLIAGLWLLLPERCSGGHAEMFSCRSSKSKCAVEELTDGNYASRIAANPHFVMFYAPWCGHCKALAPKLKKAAKELAEFGVKVGAVDVEPNKRVQSQYPDIRGFPTLKFVKSASSAEDYNGQREVSDIVAFSKEQAAKVGALVEPVAVKRNDELYTFFARAALDGKPALLLVGSGKDDPKNDDGAAAAPEWFSKLHASLKEDGAGFEEEAAAKLREALDVAKDRSVRASVQTALDEIAQRKKASTKPMFSSAFTPFSSDEGDASFNASSLYVAFVDKKNLFASTLCAYPDAVATTPPKASLLSKLEAFAKASSKDSCSLAMPKDLPKPKSVRAAEERAAKKKAQSTQVSVLASPEDLQSKCYGLADRTCALVLGDIDATELAAKYARNGFSFAKLDDAAPPALATSLLADHELPTLVVLKGAGKRARAARASGGLPDFQKLLDDVLGGSAAFVKFDGGLPVWPAADDSEEL